MADFQLLFNFEGSDLEPVGFCRNITGSPVLSASAVAAGTDGYFTPYAGVYVFTFASATTLSVAARDVKDTDNPLLFAGTITVVCDGSTENKNVLQGWSVVFQSGVQTGDKFEIGIGCFNDDEVPLRVLSRGGKLAGYTTSEVSLTAKNTSGETLDICKVVATNAIRVVNVTSPTRPFAQFWQSGYMNPTADENISGAAVTFVRRGARHANAYVLAMTSNTNIPHQASASYPATGYEAYKAFDGDTSTELNGYKSTQDPFYYGPFYVNLQLDYYGGGAQTFTHAEIYPFYDSSLLPTGWPTFPSGITFQGYSTGTGWKDLTEYLDLAEYPAYGESLVIEFTKNTGSYTYYRMKIESRFNPAYAYIAIAELIYGTGAVDPGSFDMLIDGDPVGVIDLADFSYNQLGEGLIPGHTYRFADGSKYQSGTFVLSSTMEDTDTATIYVSDGGSILEVAQATGDFSKGHVGAILTQSGQQEGWMLNSGEVSFRIRDNPPSLTSVLNMRSFSLRLVGSQTTTTTTTSTTTTTAG